MAEKRELEVQKVIVVGAGPVGALAALYAGKRGDEVHVYELRDGEWFCVFLLRDDVTPCDCAIFW